MACFQLDDEKRRFVVEINFVPFNKNTLEHLNQREKTAVQVLFSENTTNEKTNIDETNAAKIFVS